MRILVANKYLYPRGGDCIYTLRLMKLLAESGHTVIPFSMQHPENIKTEYDRYFVPHIDFREELKRFGVGNIVRVISRSIVNTQALRLFEDLIRKTKPDVVHLNNIHHQLTPAIATVPSKYGIPVVWTLHDYTFYCPDSTFLRRGEICTKCARGNYAQAVIHRCKKGSLGASLLAALECTLFKPRRLSKFVNRFICPSRFVADTMVEHGLPADKVTIIPNCLEIHQPHSKGEDYFLYVGRLSAEKGVSILLDAITRLRRGRLLIAGDGAQRDYLHRYCQQLKLSNVDFLGQQAPDRVRELLSGCRALIVPSICWENLPYTIIEAMAAGKPVIASRTGGIPELVEHGRTGYLFEMKDSDRLAGFMAELLDNRGLARKMGEAGYEKASREFGQQPHYQKIVKLYREVIDMTHREAPQARLPELEAVTTHPRS